MASTSANIPPGRPRRQQAYRRANTSLTLSSSDLDAPSPSYKYGDAGGRKMSTGSLKEYLPTKGLSTSSSTLHLSRPLGIRSNDSDTNLINSSVSDCPFDPVEELKPYAAPKLQPKYSYLIGKSTGQKTDTDFWRKSNAVSIVSSNVYQQPGSRRNSQQLPEIDPSLTSASSVAYEDRISTALRKNSSSTPATTNYNVKKSRSYGNFDAANRDLNLQVCRNLKMDIKLTSLDFIQ